MLEKQNENLPKPEVRPQLADRLDSWWLEQNAWKALNGGCAISADLKGTLELLRDNVLPRREDLPELVRRTVEGKDKSKRDLETIWAEKITEGATHVGVLEGAFHFFRGEEMLPEDNDDLRINALPPILRFRAIEKGRVAATAHREEMSFHDENKLPPMLGPQSGREEISPGETALT